MVVCNGSEWRMYDVFRQAQLSERLVMELKIETLPSHVNALQSLSMWRTNLGSGSEPTAANEPILISTMTLGGKKVAQTASQPVVEQDISLQSPKPEIGNTEYVDDGWLFIAKRSKRSWTAIHRKLSQIKIDGEVQKRSDETYKGWDWADFDQLIGKWLVNKGKLQQRDCPVFVTNSTKRCLINDQPAHPDGTPFIDHSRRTLPHDMWIETNHGAEEHVDYAAQLLEEFGVDPATVMVKLVSVL